MVSDARRTRIPSSRSNCPCPPPGARSLGRISMAAGSDAPAPRTSIGQGLANLGERRAEWIAGGNELDHAPGHGNERSRREVGRRDGAGEHQDSFRAAGICIHRVVRRLDEEPVGFARRDNPARGDDFTDEGRPRRRTLNLMNRQRACLSADSRCGCGVCDDRRKKNTGGSQSTKQPVTTAVNEHRCGVTDHCDDHRPAIQRFITAILYDPWKRPPQ